MPVPTPFHPRTSSACTSLRWKEWAGYHAVCSYDTCHEPEYMAFRHAAGLLDVTPLHKLAVAGPDAAELLAWAMTRDVGKLGEGRVTYGPWVDEAGYVIDDGTVLRKDDGTFRVTTAEPSWAWLTERADGFDVSIDDETDDVAALALQGPSARDVLVAAVHPESADAVRALRFFRWTRARVADVPLEITRTGYTGDLGYELWMPADAALPVWDRLFEVGRDHRLMPCGLDALDVTRIEAGFLLLGVDYRSARACVEDHQKRTPYELGLGAAVQLDRQPFVGQAALRRHAERPRFAFRSLEVDWDDLEAVHGELGLTVELPHGAWRSSAPLYADGRQVGYATSGAWSPICKRYLIQGSVRPDWAALGTRLQFEITVEHEPRRVGATIVRRPAFDPERKRS